MWVLFWCLADCLTPFPTDPAHFYSKNLAYPSMPGNSTRLLQLKSFNLVRISENSDSGTVNFSITFWFWMSRSSAATVIQMHLSR
jgi:hypothetical protein